MKKWMPVNGDFYLQDVSSQIITLPPAVYQLRVSERHGFYLAKLMDEFEIPSRIYGSDQVFVDRVLKSYNEINANQGVLLSGLQGTGKTLATNMIANQSGRPVILITDEHEQMADQMTGFLASIEQEAVILIDEYDKIFGDSDRLLSLMDGVFNSKHKKLFLLTKNDGRISRFMLNRPGRIRYVKEYGNLDSEVVREIVDDLLQDLSQIDELVEKFRMAELITVDTVRNIIVEMNLHQCTVDEAFEHFNISLSSNLVDIAELSEDDKHESPIASGVRIDQLKHYQDLPLMKGKYLNYRSVEDDWWNDLGQVEEVKGNVLIMKNRKVIVHKHFVFSAASFSKLDAAY